MLFNFNFFKSDEQRRAEEAAKKREQKLACRQAMLQMEKCENRLAVTLDKCKQIIIDCELSGRHNDALRQVRCYRSVEGLKNKVSTMRTRIQMIMEMQDVSDIMAKFMKDCTGMAGILEGIVNPSKLFASQAELDKAMMQMDQILDNTDVLFDSISSNDDMVYATADDENTLTDLLYQEKGASQIREIDELNRQLEARKKNSSKG